MLRKILTALFALGLIGTGLVIVAAAASAAPGDSWSLSSDAIADPTGNPIGDHYGNADVWSYLAGTGVDPSLYTLMSNETTDACGAGVDIHDTGSDLPLALVNTTTNDRPCRPDIRDQAQGVSVHPSGSQDAIVSWTSPVFANVSFDGAFSDGDPNGGNGFGYIVLDNSTVEATGVVDNGGSADTGPITMAVHPGDTIDVLIDNRDGDYAYDTTAIDETITELAPPTITASSPSSAPQGSTTSVTITGTNFTPSSAVSLDYAPGVTVGAPTARSTTSITVPVTVADDAPDKARHWVLNDPGLTNPINCGACVLRIPATPKLTSVLPSSIRRGSTVQVRLNGMQFKPGLKVAVSGDGVTIGTVHRISSTIAYAFVTVDATATRGKRNVSVINPGNGRATLVRALMLS